LAVDARVEPLELNIAFDLISLVDNASGGDLLDRVGALRRKIATELGFVMPSIRTRDAADLPAGTYLIKVHGVEVGRGVAPVGRVLVIDNGGHCSRHILTDIVAKIGSRLSLLQMPSNLGVPTSWNLGIKATPFASWWLVSNFDVVWPAGSLEAMANKADPAALVLSGGSPPWCAFAIGERVVRQRILSLKLY
jgi:GT2 family glycosyltransferase